MPESLLDAALDYASLGLRIFPVQPGGKSPLTPNGFHDACSDTDQIETWWTDHPTANIGCVLDDIFVVDIDPGGESWLTDEPEKHADLIQGATQNTPRGGTHHFFAKPEGRQWSRKVKQVHEHVDLLTNGGYVILSPSEVIGVGKYRWLPGCELDTLEELTDPPQWLTQKMDSLHGKRNGKPKTKTPKAGNTIPDGQRNQTLASLGGTMRRAGMTQAEIEPALQAANNQRCSPPLDTEEVAKIAWSVSRYAPDQITTAIVEGWANQYQMVPDKEESKDQPGDPGDFPQHLLDCGGLMGQFADYTNAVSRRLQPVLSLGAAISLMSAITGRKVKDNTGTRGNVYCVNVAKSGQGKNNGLNTIKAVLSYAEGIHLLHPSGFHSESSIWTLLLDQPCQLATIDEFGHYLTSTNSSRSGSHLRAVPKTLMQLFSASDSIAAPPASADRTRNQKVDQPHLTILGASTPGTFFESISQEMVESGFLPRLLFFVAADKHPDLRQNIPEMSPPESLIHLVREWVKFRPGGNLQDVNTPSPHSVGLSQEADAFIYDLIHSVNEIERLANDVYQPIWARAIEMFRKVALLHACSLAESPEQVEIGLESVKWAWGLVDYLYRKLEYLISEHMASSEFESYQMRFTRWLRGQEGKRATHRRAMMNVLKKFPKRLRDDIVATLIDSGKIWTFSEDTGGRPRIWYSMNEIDWSKD